MNIQYKLSLFIVALILLTGLIVIVFTSKMLGNTLEQNLFEREKIGVIVIEKRITPYMFEKDYVRITDVLFEEKGIKKDILEYILVYDSNNNIVAHTFLADAPKEIPQLHVHKEDEVFDVIEHNMNGKNLIDIVYPIKEGTHLLGHIHVGYKKTYIKDIVSQIVTVLTFVVVLVSFFTGFLGFFVSNLITRPIKKLSKGMNEVSSGNLGVVLDIKTGDELESLGNAFNKMASDLRESQEKIRKQNEELEQKVEERTYDIQEGKRAIINMMDDTEKLNTELIAAQEKLRQNLNALKETDVKKNQFISIAAHELKTPLTSIHGFSQLLQNRDIAKNQKKREKYLKIMDHETLRLSKIVNDMLDLSRLDLNAVTFDISKVDMNKIIEDIRTEMNIQAKAKGLEIEYSLERSLPKIITDKERLTQILMNLINNAVKYTPKGKITVKVSMEGKDMHFIVKDTGLGIAKNNQDKIFGRFYQVDSSYTRSAGGVGLGLSLCKEFVEVLGGKLWCESAPGKGSEFHFTLPLKFKQAVRKIKK